MRIESNNHYYSILIWNEPLASIPIVIHVFVSPFPIFFLLLSPQLRIVAVTLTPFFHPVPVCTFFLVVPHMVIAVISVVISPFVSFLTIPVPIAILAIKIHRPNNRRG